MGAFSGMSDNKRITKEAKSSITAGASFKTPLETSTPLDFKMFK